MLHPLVSPVTSLAKKFVQTKRVFHKDLSDTEAALRHHSLNAMDIQDWLSTRLSRIEMEFIDGTVLKEELTDLAWDILILTGDVTLGNLVENGSFYSVMERCDQLIDKI